MSPWHDFPDGMDLVDRENFALDPTGSRVRGCWEGDGLVPLGALCLFSISMH